MRYKIFLSCFISFLFLLLFRNFSFSQSSDFRFQLFFFQNDSIYYNSLIFGGHPNATYCIDENLEEQELPPSPPTPSLDFRFVVPRNDNQNCFGLGLKVDIRFWGDSISKDTFKIRIIPIEEKYPTTIRWDNNFSKYLHSAKLTDKLINPTIEIDMLQATQIQLTDLDIRNYFIVVEKKPIGTVNYPPTPVNVAPLDGARLSVDSALLVWKLIPSAYRYRLQISRDVFFNDLVLTDTTLTDTTFLVRNLKIDDHYYWRVYAINESMLYSCSQVRYFVFDPPRLGSPTLLTPFDNSYGVSRFPTLTWIRSLNATSNELEVATDSNFQNIIFHDSLIFTNFKQIGPLDLNKLYYWRVRTKNIRGNSPYSSVYRFYVSLPATPVTYIPTDNEMGISKRPFFMWSITLGVVYYNLEIATDSLFSEIILNDTTSATTYRLTNPLNINTSYYWCVRAVNDNGFGKFSQVLKFTVSVPTIPILKAPPNEAIEVAIRPKFEITSQYGANYFCMQFSSDPAFNNIIREDTLSKYQTSILKPLLPNTKYYWRASAMNDNGSSEYSQSSMFTTGTDSIPLRFSIPLVFNTHGNVKKDTLKFGGHRFGTYCVDESIGEIPLTPVSSGFDVRFIDTRTDTQSCLGHGVKSDFRTWYDYYQDIDSFQISIQANPSDYPIDISWPTYVNSYYNYFMEIREVGGTQVEDMLSSHNLIVHNSSVSKLKIYAMYNKLDQTWTGFSFMLISPPDDSEIITLTPMLRWSQVAGNVRYRLQVAKTPMFDNHIIDTNSITQDFKTVGPLSNYTRYYWRVQVRTESGVTYWSPISRFTTVSSVSVEDNVIIPNEYQLYQNYPNPFNPTTQIKYDLPRASKVRLVILDLLGKQVDKLVDETQNAGSYNIQWRSHVSSGIYFYRLEAVDITKPENSFVQVKKMLYLK